MSKVDLTKLSDGELSHLTGRINAEVSDRERRRRDEFNDAVQAASLHYRRFGKQHDRPCNDPAVLTCAKWPCQSQGQCVLPARSALAPEIKEANRGEG